MGTEAERQDTRKANSRRTDSRQKNGCICKKTEI